MYKNLFTAGKSYFLLLKFNDISPEFSEMFPCQKKFPKFDKIGRNIFRGIFLRKEISPRELSGICWNKTRVYSRKIVFFCHVASLELPLWQVGHGAEKFPKSFPGVSGNIRDNSGIKVYKHLFTAGKLYFLSLKFYKIFPGIFRNVPRRKKISENCPNLSKLIFRDFPEISGTPGYKKG